MLLRKLIPTVLGGGSSTPWYLAGGASGCIQALRFKGAANSTVALTDQSGSGNHPTVVGSPTWSSANGAGGFTAANYLNTLINPTSTMTVLCGFSGAAGHEKNPFGVAQSTPSRYFYYNPTFLSTSNVWYYWGAGGLYNAGAVVTAGVMAMVGKSNAFRAFWNGTFLAQTSQAWSAMTQPIFIGCRNTDGTPGQPFAGYVTGFALYDNGLSDVAVAGVAGAMANF